MSIAPENLSDPLVRSLALAINTGDREGFLSLLTDDATLSDDGSDRDLRQWIDKEIFTAGGHMDVRSEADGGRSLIADFRNDTWGEMRTAWRFEMTDGRISRIETGQA
ncbi:nuclear transport factor 2 family protein [Streptomyces syringium]|uniref:nuclear transport factor 2 family protein n=1 Tax=Streptomyces syringium TaxID=76729 RepID=UPI0036A75C3A